MSESIPADVAAIIERGSALDRLELAKSPKTSDAIRLALRNDPAGSVRAAAALGARSDATRLAFKDDASQIVRAAAVRRAKSDATRLIFRQDAAVEVRQAAVSNAEQDTTRLAFLEDVSPVVRAEAVRNAKLDATRLAFKDDPIVWVRLAAARGLQTDDARLAVVNNPQRARHFLSDAEDTVCEVAYAGMESPGALTAAFGKETSPRIKKVISRRLNELLSAPARGAEPPQRFL